MSDGFDAATDAVLRGAASIVLADGADGADIVPGLLAAAGRLGDARVVVDWVPGARPWEAGLVGADALMGGYGVRAAIRDGRATYRRVRLSEVPDFLRTLPRPLVAVLRGAPAGDGFVTGGSVGWGPLAAALADGVVVEVDAAGPLVRGVPIPGRVVGVVEGSATPVVPEWPEPDAADRVIASHVMRVLPPEPTIQYGPGALLDAIVRAVDRPVGVFSGLATDAVADLAADGRLRGPAVVGYLWGTARLHALTHEGAVRLAPSDETHDGTRLAGIPQLVALNTALQVGLDGAVNVERLGHDVVGGVGGHPDFSAGAHACPDGISLVVCRSTYRDRSTVVPSPLVVTTPGALVDVVVTEHGVADLRGRSREERARLLAEIAHPDHREALRKGEDPNG